MQNVIRFLLVLACVSAAIGLYVAGTSSMHRSQLMAERPEQIRKLKSRYRDRFTAVFTTQELQAGQMIPKEAVVERTVETAKCPHDLFRTDLPQDVLNSFTQAVGRKAKYATPAGIALAASDLIGESSKNTEKEQP